MEKDVELAQVQMSLENEGAELRHHKQQKEKLQQQYDDSKKTHKLEPTKVNKVLSSNSEEIFRLRNHNKTLVIQIKKLKSKDRTIYGRHWRKNSRQTGRKLLYQKA